MPPSTGGKGRGRPRFGQTKRTFSLTIDDDTYEQFAGFFKGEQFGSEGQAALVLIKMAFTAHPNLTLMNATRRKAYLDTRRWMLSRLESHLIETVRLIRAEQQTDAARILNEQQGVEPYENQG